MRVLALVGLILVLAACATPLAPTPQPPTAAPATPRAPNPALRPEETRAAETRAAEAVPARSNTIAPPHTISSPDAIQPSFFAMTTVNENDYPKLTFGTLGHPQIGAWAWIEQKKGVYNFSLFDREVSQAAAHGLVDSTNTVNMAITLGETPPWAAADQRSCETVKGFGRCTSGPANVQDWSNFVTAVMNHYNGVTAPHVRYYELWNEMNINLFWTGTQTDMVNLAQVAYPVVHADAHSMLLTPSVAGPVGNLAKNSGTTWMADYLDAGGAKYADGGRSMDTSGDKKA